MIYAAVLAALCLALAVQADAAWEADFAAQPVASRPRLEARYLDATRTALEILGETYEVRLNFGGEDGQRGTISVCHEKHRSFATSERPDATSRKRPDATSRVPTGKRPAAELWVEAQIEGRRAYSSLHAKDRSRVNIYRRGPYYIEVHWFDVACLDSEGEAFPAKGEVVLHCYPEKVHAQAIWHAVGETGAGTVSLALRSIGEGGGDGLTVNIPQGEQHAEGLRRSTTAFDSLKEGEQVSAALAFAPASEGGRGVSLDEPLPEGALEVLEGLGARYDPVRGCYMVGTRNPGGFNYHFYENQNYYQTARFAIHNDGRARKVYVCHETTEGARGSVECGVLLDGDGDPLPMLVQISKNFAGEKEEPFYNPHDTPFSETIFPLHLAANETREVTSFHLYQNWGNHPLKQFSSLGAWMDYYHSSTGVTETTCFVPFKFGGLSGVAIADLRPMSQRMWKSQPQHDNVAGHRFLMYKADGAWHYGEYVGTTFRSTGPNWFDISMEYLSDDGCIRARLDSFELPQTDELRNFLRLRCEVLKPVSIESLATDFRLMDITTRIQRLRYTHVAWQAGPERVEVRELPKGEGVAVVPGEELGGEFPWATVYGDKRGCNSFVVRKFKARLGGEDRKPAVVAHTVSTGDCHLALTASGGPADLKPGDFVDAEFYIMPYGDESNTHETPEADRAPFGVDAPRITHVTRGTKLADFPCRLRADDEGQAEFAIRGGVNAIPIIIEGLSTYKHPRLEVEAADGRWIPVPHETIGNDGYQVFVADDGSFGCVFLVEGRTAERTYRLSSVK